MSTDDTAVPPVSLVGGGPGELDLLTLAAEAALVAARAIVADRSLAPMVDALAVDGVLSGVVPLVLVDDDRPAIVQLLAAVRGGPSVVRLYRGDPWFHPAGDQERAALAAAGVRAVSVAGVVEELAAAAAAGIPIQVRTHAVATTFAFDDNPPPVHHLHGSECTNVTPAAGSALRTVGVGVPADAGHTLVVRTTDLSRTAARLAERAALDGVDGDRSAAALPIGIDPGRAQPVRATVATLAPLCPPGPGVVVVGVVAALDTRLARPVSAATR